MLSKLLLNYVITLRHLSIVEITLRQLSTVEIIFEVQDTTVLTF